MSFQILFSTWLDAGGLDVFFILRAQTTGSRWSGQVGFPGGHAEAGEEAGVSNVQCQSMSKPASPSISKVRTMRQHPVNAEKKLVSFWSQPQCWTVLLYSSPSSTLIVHVLIEDEPGAYRYLGSHLLASSLSAKMSKVRFWLLTICGLDHFGARWHAMREIGSSLCISISDIIECIYLLI